MSWLTGGSQAEAKKWIAQLADPLKQDSASAALIQMGADAVVPLIEALQTRDLGLIPLYQQVLARIPSASPVLIKTLAVAHPLIRARAVDVFALNRDRSAIPALLDALNGEYFTVRSRAARVLGLMKENSAVPQLILMLKDPEAEVRAAVCYSLGEFNDASLFDEIANPLFDDPIMEVRQAAASALGETRNLAAIPYLMDALRDSFWWYEHERSIQVLIDAIQGMGSAVIEPLIEALGDREGTVRRYAAIMLGNLKDPAAMDELGMALYDLHSEVGKAASEALAKFGIDAVGLLVDALQHPEAAVRGNAVTALGRIPDPRIVQVLVDMLLDPDREVQKQAMDSLAKFNDPRVFTALQEIAVNRLDREMSAFARSLLEQMK